MSKHIKKIESEPLSNDLLKNPAHINPKKIKKIDLEQIEEELWLGE